jgi:hypothetical protein
MPRLVDEAVDDAVAAVDDLLHAGALISSSSRKMARVTDEPSVTCWKMMPPLP